MANLQKGKISTIEGDADRNGDKTAARVLPDTADGVVSRPLVIPWYLRGKMGDLQPQDAVVYVVFEDGTGIILSRMDGEWPGIIPGDVELIKGALKITDKDLIVEKGNETVKAGDVIITNGDAKAGNISLKHHTHTGVHGETSEPN